MKKIALLLSISFIFYACPKSVISDNCSREYFSFDIPVSFEPMDSIVHVGDTMTVTSTFSNKLKSNETGELFLFDSIDFKISCHFIKVDTVIDGQGRFYFLDDFEVFADSIYNYRHKTATTAFDYYYDGNKYYLQFKFIPLVEGIYVFEFSSRRNLSSFDYDDAYIFEEGGDCQTNRWSPKLVTNNGNAYQELLKYSPNEYYKEKSGYYFHPQRDGAHCFKVE